MAAGIEVVESIRQYINGHQALLDRNEPAPALTTDEYSQLQILADNYAQLCRSVNQRAEQAHELLRSGSRPEAAELAKQSPDLRMLFEQAAFGQLGLWLDICETYGLPLPFVLDYEKIEAVVDDVYGVSHAREQLLRLHRQFALGRAPLADRVHVLRKLHQIDPDNTDWTEDLAVFEPAFVEELLRRAERADARGDLPALDKVRDELTSGAWLKVPDHKAIVLVDNRIKPHRQKHAAATYQGLSEDLRDAHAAMDESRCRSLMDQWRQVAVQTGHGPSAELGQLVEPVEQWLIGLGQAKTDEDAYQRDCATLERALDERMGLEDLDRLAANALRHDRGMPELLAARFSSCVQEMRSQSRRHFTLKLAAIIGAAAMVVVIVVAVFIWHSQNKEHRHWRDQISAAISNNKLDDAEDRLAELEQINQRIYNSADIVALRERVKNLRAEEDQRREGFEKAMSAAEAAGVLEPNTAAIARAESLAKTPEELTRLAEFQTDVARQRDASAQQQQEAIEAALVELEELDRQLQAMDFSDPQAVQLASQACIDRAEQIASMDGLAGYHLRRLEGVRTTAEAKLSRARQQGDADADIAERLARLPGLVLAPTSFIEALAAFRDAHPEHPRSAQFAQAMVMSSHWQAMEAWHRMVGGPWRGRVRVDSGQQAQTRQADVSEYLQDYPAGPYSVAARQYADYLGVAAVALSEDPLNHVESLQRLLRSDLMSNLQMLTMADGRRYFFLSENPPKPLHVGESIAHYELQLYEGPERPMRAIRIRPEEYDLAVLTPAPQNAFAQEALTQTAALDRIGWETFYVQLASQLAVQTDIDAILRALVVQDLLTFAEDTTPLLTDDVARIRGELEGLYLGEVTGLEADSDTLRDKRRRSNERLRQISVPLTELTGGVVSELAAMGQACETLYWPVGVVLDGKAALSETDKTGTLYVLTEGEGNGPTFSEIGSLTADGADVVAGILSSRPEGTLVFVKE